MTPGLAAALAAHMNQLPFVRWDRFTTDADEPGDDHIEDVTVYGWIDRPDGRADFVILRWEGLGHSMAATDPPGFTTSSAEHSVEIGRLLYGQESEHYPCQRVDEHFGNLVVSKVVLA